LLAPSGVCGMLFAFETGSSRPIFSRSFPKETIRAG
jgi:hypothetical protein